MKPELRCFDVPPDSYQLIALEALAKREPVWEISAGVYGPVSGRPVLFIGNFDLDYDNWNREVLKRN